MFRKPAFHLHSDTRVAPGVREFVGRHTPKQNDLLAALPLNDYERVLPYLEPVPLPLGWIVHRAGDLRKVPDFLTAGIVSRFYVTASGASAGFAVTGSEGVIGVASFLGGERTLTRAVVLSAGYAYRLGAQALRSESNTTVGWPVYFCAIRRR